MSKLSRRGFLGTLAAVASAPPAVKWLTPPKEKKASRSWNPDKNLTNRQKTIIKELQRRQRDALEDMARQMEEDLWA